MSGGEKHKEPRSVLDKLRDMRVPIAAGAAALALSGCAAPENNANTERKPDAVAVAIEVQPDGNTLLLSEEKLKEMNTSWVDSTVGTINDIMDNSSLDGGQRYVNDWGGSMMIYRGGDSGVTSASLLAYTPGDDSFLSKVPTLQVDMRIDGDAIYHRGVELANPDVEMNDAWVTTEGIVTNFFTKGDGPRPVAAYRVEKDSNGYEVPSSRVVAIIDQKAREVAVFEGDTRKILPGDKAKEELEDMDEFFSGRDRGVQSGQSDNS